MGCSRLPVTYIGAGNVSAPMEITMRPICSVFGCGKPVESKGKTGFRSKCTSHHRGEKGSKKANHDRKSRDTLIKERVFAHYGLECVCCGESEIVFLTIDHMNNDGAEHRREIGRSGIRFYRWLTKNGLPDGYQTLCFNCNVGRYINGGVCPHKLKNTLG